MNSRKIARIALKRGATQKVKELSPLISLLKRRKLRTVVEIGTQKGGTLYAWCRIAQPDALIVSIDLPGGPFGGGYRLCDMKTFRRYKRKDQKLCLLRMDSHRLSTKKELLGKLQGREIDFLLIDGDHRYNGVKRDWQMYSPLVKRNGIIAFHDILYHPGVPACKVNRFWHEVEVQYRHSTYIDKKDDRGWGRWGGIGVIYT
jgi:predicted O-methyltransferase YrrM